MVLLLSLWWGLAHGGPVTPAEQKLTCTDSHLQLGVAVLDARSKRGSWLRGSALARTWCGEVLAQKQDLLIELVLADLCQLAELQGEPCAALERISRAEVERALTEPRLVALSLDPSGPGQEIGLVFADDSTRSLTGEVRQDGKFQSKNLAFAAHRGPDEPKLDCTVSLKIAVQGAVETRIPSEVALSRTRTLLCRSPSGDRFLKLEVEHLEESASDGAQRVGQGSGTRPSSSRSK